MTETVVRTFTQEFEKFRNYRASLATCIIELTPDGVIDYAGSYDECLRTQFSGQVSRVA
jgi:hypothetical protein